MSSEHTPLLGSAVPTLEKLIVQWDELRLVLRVEKVSA